MKINFFILAFSIVIFKGYAQSVNAEHRDINASQCLATREYLTVVEYFRDHKEFRLADKNIQEIADQVSQGCSEASQRFIRVTELLLKANLDYQSSINTALKFVHATEEQTQSFLIIFANAFVEERLNMDLLHSIKMALSLSVDFGGDTKKARMDFNKLVSFCVSERHLDLPLAECAQLAAEITKKGADYAQPISKPFIELFQFITENVKGPKRTTFEGLKIAKRVLDYGPVAAQNFTQAYLYAIHKDGLDFDSTRAIGFAIKMSERTKKTKEENIK